MTPPPPCLSFDILFLFKHRALWSFFPASSLKGICLTHDFLLSANLQSAEVSRPESICQSVRHIHYGLVWNESLNIRTRQTRERKSLPWKLELDMGTSVWQGESTRECQIRPPGSLSLHLRADNAGLPISVHELHRFSGSITEIDVSFPSPCLSNTALSYLCQSVSPSLVFFQILAYRMRRLILEGMRK